MKKIKELFMTSPSIKHTFNYHLKKCVNIFEKERMCQNDASSFSL